MYTDWHGEIESHRCSCNNEIKRRKDIERDQMLLPLKEEMVTKWNWLQTEAKANSIKEIIFFVNPSKVFDQSLFINIELVVANCCTLKYPK